MSLPIYFVTDFDVELRQVAKSVAEGVVFDLLRLSLCYKEHDFPNAVVEHPSLTFARGEDFTDLGTFGSD